MEKMTNQLVQSPVPGDEQKIPSGSIQAAGRRRQWGSERRSEPLAIVHPTPSARKIVLGRLAILVTIGSWIYYVISTVIRQLVDNPNSGFRFGFESFSYLIVVTFLTFSALMYLMARQGALHRFREHRRVPRGELDSHFANYDEAVTVLDHLIAREAPEVTLQQERVFLAPVDREDGEASVVVF